MLNHKRTTSPANPAINLIIITFLSLFSQTGLPGELPTQTQLQLRATKVQRMISRSSQRTPPIVSPGTSPETALGTTETSEEEPLIVMNDEAFEASTCSDDGIHVEVGPGDAPVLPDRANSIFIDEVNQIGAIRSNSKFLMNDVEKGIELGDSSVSVIVSKHFPWSLLKKGIPQIMKSYNRILQPGGKIFIYQHDSDLDLTQTVKECLNHVIDAAEPEGLQVQFVATPTYGGIILRKPSGS